VHDRLDLRTGEVRAHDEPGLTLHRALDAVIDQALTDVTGAGVLPDHRVVDRLAGLLLPDHGGLTLVGDPDARDLVGLDPFLLHRSLDDALGLFPVHPRI